MKCIIPGPNVKAFARAIHALAKIGEELYLVPQTDGLALRTINSSKSAFASFLFNPNFFSVYDEETLPEDSNNCKITMRSAVAVFKSISHVDRMVEAGCLQIIPNEAKVKIELRCKYNVTKNYAIPFLESDTVKAQYDDSASANRLEIDSKTLSSVFDSFLQNQEEVTMIASPGEFQLRNYIEDHDSISSQKAVSTVFTMKIPEFHSYAISRTSSVTYCLKELRSFNGFAEAFCLPLSASFDVGGKPIIFTILQEGLFEAALVMATIEDGAEVATRGLDPSPRNKSVCESHNLVERPKISTQRDPGRLSDHYTPPVTPILPMEAMDRDLPTPTEINGNLDDLPLTPPSKKARHLFQRCFDATFYPQDMTAVTRVLAPDSDDEDS
eukprot:snap_masked-scaffold121_size336169-processed-gene-2.1 protein:Tk01639 transcript:snap_masked-scaffold121_size336169-processed-gene-2.1-mRNA-1 annotation:"cell cycle checkpoint control protein rad9a"